MREHESSLFSSAEEDDLDRDLDLFLAGLLCGEDEEQEEETMDEEEEGDGEGLLFLLCFFTCLSHFEECDLV